MGILSWSTRPEKMIAVRNLRKTYRLDGQEVRALAGVSFELGKGSFTAVMGPSGSGKTTLMNILGCLDTPTSGDYFLNERNVARLSENELSEIRNRQIGFVFQSHNLLPRNTTLENVCLPLYYRGDPKPYKKARSALERVGLSGRAAHYPSQLSGGESQRAAIARAIVTDPKIILADEPTGNLDTKTGARIMEILGEFNKAGVTLLVVTHDPEIAGRAGSVMRIRDGELMA